MKILYIIKPNRDSMVKFGIAGHKEGKDSAWGRLFQYVNSYGIQDDLNQCSGVQLLYIVGHKYNSNVEPTQSFVHKKEKYIITNVTFRLTKNNHNTIIEYGSIKQELEKFNIHSPSIKDISEVIIKIRESKLPNPNEIGNSGSFFKNPTINNIEFEKFYKNFPTAPFYKLSEFEYKIPAGWLIEKAGFKGQRFGDAGVHKNQALVLVNHGNASGKEILELAEKIQTKVKQDFGILIESEVNIV